MSATSRSNKSWAPHEVVLTGPFSLCVAQDVPFSWPKPGVLSFQPAGQIWPVELFHHGEPHGLGNLMVGSSGC